MYSFSLDFSLIKGWSLGHFTFSMHPVYDSLSWFTIDTNTNIIDNIFFYVNENIAYVCAFQIKQS